MENEKLSFSVLADIYGKLLTGRQLDILREWADCDTSLAEIAEKYGIARQSVKDSLQSARNSLLKFEGSLGLKGKTERIAGLKGRDAKTVEDILAILKE